MERPQPVGEPQLLTHLLLDRHDMAAGIALACLHGCEATFGPEKTNSAATVDCIQTRVDVRDVELEVIGWAAAGKSYPDIAVIMDIPYGTVRYHLDQARRRNGFDTVIQLVVRTACDYDLSPLAG